MIKFEFLYANIYKKPIDIKMHYHSCYEFVYYIKANGFSEYMDNFQNINRNIDKIEYVNYMNIDNTQINRINFSNHTFVLYPPGSLHNEVHNHGAELIAIGFQLHNPTYSFFKSLFFVDDDFKYNLLFQKCKLEYLEKNKRCIDMIETIINEILILIDRDEPNNKSHMNSILFAKNYIDQYFTTKIDFDELASSAGYCKEHFRLLFKKQTGYSPKEYILSKRLDYSKKLLAETSLPLSQIGTLAGFSEYSQFSIFFKLKTGISPSKYRDKCNNKYFPSQV
ncbi:MAG: helix-turn-helix transcriptional regulator [Candidatus Methanofastidiosa archaeon]|nr:helix-turn-helix transcriptional regulator [Candidatus Methanofastidiosa archaeon]